MGVQGFGGVPGSSPEFVSGVHGEGLAVGVTAPARESLDEVRVVAMPSPAAVAPQAGWECAARGHCLVSRD
jgi:hypothetical protein